MLTRHEERVIDKIVLVWNDFIGLPQEHPDDVDEFRRHIHALQEKILARPGRRQLNAKRQFSPEEKPDDR